MQQCQACLGTYDPVLPDGMHYFHACPPLSVPELQAALAAHTLRLNPAAQTLYAQAVAQDAVTPTPPGSPTRVQQVLATLAVVRPRARNDNVVPPATPHAAAAPISEGAGVIDLPPAAVAPAATILTP